MPELDRSLEALASQIDWPATPRLAVPAQLATDPRQSRRGRRRGLMVALAAAALALAVAFAEPGARGAILHFFHVGRVSIERVGILPAAEQRALAAGIGSRATAAQARDALGEPVRLPSVTARPALYLESGVVSTLLATPSPVLLSELRSGGDTYLLKKFVGDSTGVTSVEVRPGAPGVWISGREHVLMSPAAPPRVAGNVLIWVSGEITYRLEGRDLDERLALRLAREISR